MQRTYPAPKEISRENNQTLRVMLPYSGEQRRGELSEKGVKTKDLIALCAEAKLTGSYKNKSKVELIELLVAHGKDEYNAYLKKQGISSKINYAALSSDGSNDESNFLIKPSASKKEDSVDNNKSIFINGKEFIPYSAPITLSVPPITLSVPPVTLSSSSSSDVVEVVDKVNKKKRKSNNIKREIMTADTVQGNSRNSERKECRRKSQKK